MTTAYTSLLGLALPVTGELSGTWGDTVNNSITSLLDSAIAGTQTLTADTTLTTTTGAANTSRQAILLCSPASANITITAPAQSKIYTVINTSAVYTVTIRGVGPTTGVTLGVSEKAVVAWNGSDFIKISNTAGAGTFTNLTVTGVADFADGTEALPSITNTGDTNTGIWFPAADTIAFSEGGAEAMRINSSGNVLVGTTSNASTQGATIQAITAMAARRNIAAAGGPAFRMEKSRATTDGTYTIVADTDTLGDYQFFGADGVQYVIGASVKAVVNGTPGVNDMPTALTFSTTADGAAAVTERMRIDSSGNVGIGTSSPVTKFEVAGTSSLSWTVTASVSGTTMTVTAVTSGTIANGDLVFGVNIQPYTRITALGTGTGGVGTYTVSVSQTSASGSVSGAAVYANTLIRITDTDTSVNSGQPTGGLQFFTSDVSAPTAGVGAYVAALSELGTPDTALVFGTRDNGGGGIDANERMRIDSSGNVGIGVTPSAWLAGSQAIQNSSGSFWQFNNTSIYIGQNYYTNSSSQRIYSTTAGATEYQQTAGAHIWFNAVSGTAGNVITFTQAMSLNSVGNLAIGTTTIATGYTSGNGSLTLQNAKSLALNNASNTWSTTTTGGAITYFTDNNLYIDAKDSASNVVFRVNGATERMRIDSSGNVGIGTASLTGTSLAVSKLITGTTTSYGVLNNGTIQSDVTATGIGFQATLSTQAAAFTLNEIRHYDSTQATIGASSIVSNQYAFIARSTLTGATTNYGFTGNLTAPTAGIATTGTITSISSSTTTVTVNHNAITYTNGQIVTISATANATALVSGATCTILTVGTTDFTLIGAASNTVGVSFTATGAGTGTGTVTLNVQGSGKTVAGAASGSFTYTTTTSQTFTAVTVLTGSVTVSTRYNLYMAGTADNYMLGNLGIGVTSPAAFLSLKNAATADKANSLRLFDASGTNGNNYGFGMNNSTGEFSYTAGNSGFHAWYTANTERMRIDSAGNAYIETGLLWQYAPTPTTKAAAATLTAAELATDIITLTGTTYTITLPTGTALDTYYTGVPAVNIGYDFHIVNTASGTITIAQGASGMSTVGTLTIATGVSAHFRLRRTAANTYILYRLS